MNTENTHTEDTELTDLTAEMRSSFDLVLEMEGPESAIEWLKAKRDGQAKRVAGHTPGPWKYEASTKTIRSVPANYWVASMNSWDGAVNHEAHARLIASAPELLEALKDLLSYAEKPPRFAEAMRLVKEQARAAIAKATGGNA